MNALHTFFLRGEMPTEIQGEHFFLMIFDVKKFFQLKFF